MKRVKRHTQRRAGRYHHGSLPAALVETAAQLAAERGPTGVSLREVARRVGVSQAAPYHYFADKNALLAGVADEGFRLFDRSQAAALEGAPDDPIEQLTALGIAYIRFALNHPHYFKVMFRPHGVDDGRSPTLGVAAGRTVDRLVDVVRTTRMASGYDDLDPHYAATLVWAVPHGLALLYLDGPIASTTSPRALEDLVCAAMKPLATSPLDDIGQGEPQWGI